VAKLKVFVDEPRRSFGFKALKGMEVGSVQEDVPLHDENISDRPVVKNQSGLSQGVSS
jgi:hypothetical protein